MKTFAFVLLLLLPTTAYATDYYVAVTGTSGGSGADSANAKSLVWFNQNAVAGDRAILTAGTYPDPIQPQADGTSANRIVYVGAMRAPTAAIIPNIYFGKETTASPTVNWGNYVTVKWVKCTGTAGTVNYLRQDLGGNWYADHDDSLRKVEVNGDLIMNGTNLVFDSLNVVGTNTRIRCEPTNTSYSSSNITYSYHAYNNKLAHSAITIENTQSTGDVDFVRLKAAKNWSILDNTFQLTNTGGSNNNNYCIFFQMYVCGYVNVNDNAFTFSDNGSQTGTRGLISLRDSTKWCQFFRNSITSSGSSLTKILGSNGGTQTNHTVRGNRWEDNLIKGDNISPGLFYWENGAVRDTLRFNLIATNSSVPAVQSNSTMTLDSALIAHNTLYTAGKQALALANNAGINSRVLDNILFTKTAPAASSSETVALLLGGYADASRNLYYSNAAGASSAYAVWDGTAKSPSAYGSGSAWGDPVFANSTYASLDVTPSHAGAAVGRQWLDGYEGSVYVDGLPPAAVTNLGISTGRYNAAVSWTAPGDDSLTGTATSYDLRYGTTAITDANFGDMTSAATGAPGASGSSECVEISDLSDCTRYYFALKTTDEASNTSYLSNVPSATTKCSGSIVASCQGASAHPEDEEDGVWPTRLELDRPRPNPATRSVVIRFGVAVGSLGPVDMAVYDPAGRLVRRLISASAAPGWNRVEWNLLADSGQRARPGVYFLRLRTPAETQTRLVVVAD